MPEQTGKILILDGISGISLGLEVADTFAKLGFGVSHFDCLAQNRRRFHGICSAYAKLINRRADSDSFFFLPRLARSDLQQVIEKEKPSCILVIGFIYKFFDPQWLREIADQTQSELLLYDTDSCNLYSRRREFIFFIETELPVYDRIFSFSKVTTNFFSQTRKLNAVYLPYGALPIPVTSVEKSIDVLFVGACDLRRIFLLEKIREHVLVRGSRWSRNRPLISESLFGKIDDTPIWGSELHALLDSSKIVLNITRTDFYGAETGVNLRIFEALAAGCFVLTDHCDEISELFRVGEEIETFRSSEELASKVEYYLTHEAQRAGIARNGQQAFARKHSWETRIQNDMLPLLRTQSDTLTCAKTH